MDSVQDTVQQSLESLNRFEDGTASTIEWQAWHVFLVLLSVFLLPGIVSVVASKWFLWIIISIFITAARFM
jgi:hypothetical protein